VAPLDDASQHRARHASVTGSPIPLLLTAVPLNCRLYGRPQDPCRRRPLPGSRRLPTPRRRFFAAAPTYSFVRSHPPRWKGLPAPAPQSLPPRAQWVHSCGMETHHETGWTDGAHWVVRPLLPVTHPHNRLSRRQQRRQPAVEGRIGWLRSAGRGGGRFPDQHMAAMACTTCRRVARIVKKKRRSEREPGRESCSRTGWTGADSVHPSVRERETKREEIPFRIICARLWPPRRPNTRSFV